MKHPWPLVHAERHALIDDLAELTPEQWETPSLAAGWSVHDVAAHLIDNALATFGGLLAAMVRARFDFDRQNDQGVAAQRGADPAETLQRLRSVADRTSGPPAPLASRLVEEIAHGEDIRRPLGVRRDYPLEAIGEAIRYQAGTPTHFGGAKGLARRVCLVATDGDFNLGEGPEVRAPALELLMLVTGRPVRGLQGPGMAVLRLAGARLSDDGPAN
ncbi:maleylpyruvate isomerase family mycothiol-dependent enzyme [Naumannella sp. ID2617S]|nr:maleylpyruvate isomerase family mycothiol-dependent enzyme [Naumannella sp. ID2617S]